MWLYHRVMSPNDADGMANSVEQSDLDLHCLPGISVRKLRSITEYWYVKKSKNGNLFTGHLKKLGNGRVELIFKGGNSLILNSVSKRKICLFQSTSTHMSRLVTKPTK